MDIYFIFILVKANNKTSVGSQVNAFEKWRHAFPVPSI